MVQCSLKRQSGNIRLSSQIQPNEEDLNMTFIWSTLHVRHMDTSLLFYKDVLGNRTYPAKSEYSLCVHHRSGWHEDSACGEQMSGLSQ